jgi:hypothetical protein
VQDEFATHEPEDQQNVDNVGGLPDPNEMLEVQCATDFLMSQLAEVSEDDVQNLLKDFNLTDYPLPDNQTPSVPSLQNNNNNFEQFTNIAKSLDGTESSNTRPEKFADIVQQALYDSSVFGPNDFDFSF